MFCPEDGTKCEKLHGGYHPCYQCPSCLTHWSYIEGAYVALEDMATCDLCEAADIAEEAGL